MIRKFLTMIFVVNCALTNAQFTYFNQITGESGDLSSEVCANVEVVNDGYVIWGAAIDDNILKHFIRKYNLEGEIVNENILIHQNQYVLSGIVNSFKWNPYIQKFIYIHGTNLNSGTTEGYLIEFDQNLDTVFTKRYAQYPPYTYPFIFEVEPDGYIVVGEQGGISNSNGTFIMKLDFAGNVLWSEILQPEVYQHIYRNWSIIRTDSGYLISGFGKTPDSNSEPFGLLTLIDSLGQNMDATIMVDDQMPLSGAVLATRSTSGDIILAQGFGYEWMSEFGNPNVFWNSVRIFKYDLETGDTSNLRNYFTNYEFFQGGANKLLSTPDGGVILLGGNSGYYYDYTSWMLKLDSNLNQEWFYEYTYETCDNCENILYDIELAPDGGYIAAGSFANYDIDPRNDTWLLKVDACGDVEWQGCAPVGVEEKAPKVFSVYPNPSAGRFTVETDNNKGISSWTVYNLSGQKVAEGSSISVVQSLEMNLNLPSGLYALELVQADGKRENHKIQIIK